MCGLSGVVAGLLNKVKKQSNGRREGSLSSSSSNGKGSPNGRVIPPEPVQQRPDGDLTDNEAAPALQVHNLARANKSCKKLDWDDRLAVDAAAYAEKLAEKGKLEPSRVENQCENLFMYEGDAKFEDAVQKWLNGEKRYNGEKIGEGNFEDWGDFGKPNRPPVYSNSELTKNLMQRNACGTALHTSAWAKRSQKTAALLLLRDTRRQATSQVGSPSNEAEPELRGFLGGHE